MTVDRLTVNKFTYFCMQLFLSGSVAVIDALDILINFLKVLSHHNKKQTTPQESGRQRCRLLLSCIALLTPCKQGIYWQSDICMFIWSHRIGACFVFSKPVTLHTSAPTCKLNILHLKTHPKTK